MRIEVVVKEEDGTIFATHDGPIDIDTYNLITKLIVNEYDESMLEAVSDLLASADDEDDEDTDPNDTDPDPPYKTP